MSQPQLSHPGQLDHYYDHPRDPPPVPHPNRTHQLTSLTKSKIKKLKKPVPFNRLQLAAALLEYDPIPEEPTSDIQWKLQEVPPQTHSLSIRNASQSAIFIPFRTAPLSPPKPDFFSGIGLRQAQQPKSVHSGSGFGLVDGSGHASTSMDFRRSVAGKIEGMDLLESRPATELALEEEAEVLSEWGLDNLLGDQAKNNKAKPKLSTDSDSANPNGAQNVRDNQLRHRSGRLPHDSDQPYQIKSDLFDFHFSDSRLQDADPTKNEDLLEHVGVLDDEELLRQTSWCDPEGRKLVRPHTVYEMEIVRLGHLQPSQAGLLPTRRPTQSFQRSRNPSRLSAQGSNLLSQRRNSAMATTLASRRRDRTHSLPPTGVMNFGFQSGTPIIDQIDITRARRTSTRTPNSHHPIPKSQTKHHRRSQSVGTRISGAFEVDLKKKKKASISVDNSTSGCIDNDPESQSPEAKAAKLKMRTSADIAQRYQQSIAMLESRLSEDKVYQINSDTGSAQGSDVPPEQGTGSQAGISVGSGPRPVTSQSMSTAVHGSEFSVGAPKEFTSRFDPKVTSVLGDQKQAESEGPEMDEEDVEMMDDVEEGELEETPIYDELGRIRFPTSLKPPVLIMPIPLTPNETVPEIQLQIPQVRQDGPEYQEKLEQPLEQAEEEAEETEDMRMKKKWAEQRPAGKLYGRSLIDELNSRKGAQKSRQMTFTGDGRKKMFADNLSPGDVTRPGSIYSNIDPDPDQAATLPKSPTSPSHLAYKALSASQNKFNQALISSSRARQSVFGMDRIMVAELEKLKRIKAAEDAELREMEAKAEAKESKKREKKKGKKKKAAEEAEAAEEKLEAADRVKSIRASHMLDQWDTMLLKDSSPSNDVQPDTSPRPNPLRESSIPLPVISALHSDEGRVGNMEDWFKDSPHDRDNHTASPLHGFLGVDDEDDEDDDDGFGNVNSIARKLEIQAEKMNYKPLSNVYERHVMERGQSIESHAALLAMTQQSSSNSPIPMITQEADSDVDEQDRIPLIDVARQRQSRLGNFAHGDDEEDNVPLAQHRKSMMQPKASVDDDDDDNRPLSQHLSSHILSKLNTDRSLPSSHARTSLDQRRPSHLHSPVSSIHSPAGLSSHGTDEDMPLGIRATVLLAREHHPPIDLTHDNGSSEGLIGSSATHETDDVPLAVRASVMLSQKQPEPKSVDRSFGVDHRAASGSLNEEEKEALADSPSAEDDDVPLGYRASSQFTAGLPITKPLRGPLQTNRTEEIVTASNRSIGGRSDDVPLGMKYDDDIPLASRLSTLNPLYAASGTGYNRMSQFGSLNNFQVPNSRLRGSFMTLQSQIPDEDEDDDVPLAKRASAMPSSAPVLDMKLDSTTPDLGLTPSISSAKIGGIPTSSQIPEVEEIEELALLTSPLDQSINGVTTPLKAENARADTLAALEGRNNPEENADDDVPLGVTRAAHSTVGTVRRPKKKKNKMIEKVTEEVGSDEDDVPLAAKLPESQKQQMMMNVLIEQQNSAFGYAMHQSMLPLPIGNSPMMMMNPDGSVSYQGGLVEGPDRRTVDSISRWRQDIKP